MRIGVPTEIKADEYRVAITPAGVRELSVRGHEVLVQAGAGEGSAMPDEQLHRSGRADRAGCRQRVRRSRARAQGQGAPARGGTETARGADAVHLPAPGGRARARHCAPGVRRHLHRLRDGRGRRRAPAAARADERGGREDRDPGRCLHAREAARRPRHPARRGSGRSGCDRPGHRRRRRRDERGR